MLENNPADVDRAEIERVVGNQYNRLLRQHHDSKALSASRSTTTADRGEKKRRSRNRFEGNCFNCGRKGHRAEDCRSARRRPKNQEMAPPTRRAEVGESATSVGVRSTLRINTVACAETWSIGLAIMRSEELKRVRMLAKINVSANTEVGWVAATAGAARGDGKEEWNSDSGASFHMSHTQAGMTAYKKAPAGTTVEVADGTILPVDGLGRLRWTWTSQVPRPSQ